jgi:hypothetical protein
LALALETFSEALLLDYSQNELSAPFGFNNLRLVVALDGRGKEFESSRAYHLFILLGFPPISETVKT